MKFYELAIGARFVFRGRRFEKIGMGMANNEHGCGSMFMGKTEVAPEEAARRKPNDKHWTEYLSPAPEPREPGPKARGTGRRDAYLST
jgi:hypothetical protein